MRQSSDEDFGALRARWLAAASALVLSLGLWLLASVAAGANSAPSPANRLALDASPFLRLHAQDPVAWIAYGEPAFAEAARLGRPIFVSIGYETCSGCVRMAEESFRDPKVAEALNTAFVAVMVDRDGQPELADAYARIAAAMGERIGYPLHVFLLPDGSPFHAATFLPRHDQPGQPGILTVLASVARAFASGGTPLARRGAALRAQIARDLQAVSENADSAPGARAFAALVHAQRDAIDAEWGGRLALPKRPTEPSVPLLLREHRRSGDARSLGLALLGLERMAAAPVRVAGEGGFYEAATQRDWSGPRSDQRLADNALMALAYLEGWQVSGRAALRQVARETLDFMLTALRAPGGAFAATRQGARRDEKILTGANGLAISALARVGFALADARAIEAAQSAAGFVLENLRGRDGLLAFVADGRKGPPATLADHALMIAALLDLLEADADARWLAAALALQAEQDARFARPEGGYFSTWLAPGPGLPRPLHARDGALPSAQGTTALNLLRLHALTGDVRYRERADGILAVFQEGLSREPLAHATLGLALDARLDGLHEIVVVDAGDESAGALLETLRRSFVPNRVLLIVASAKPPAALGELAPLLAGKRAIAGASTAFVCRDHVCGHPARDADTFARQLARFTPLGATSAR